MLAFQFTKRIPLPLAGDPQKRILKYNSFFTVPIIMRTAAPISIMTVWMKSVHITAVSPPGIG